MFQRIINVLVAKPLCQSFLVPITPTCCCLWPFLSFRPFLGSLLGPTLLSRALGCGRLNGPLGPPGGLLTKVVPPMSSGLLGFSLGSPLLSESERYSSEGGPLARVTSWSLLLPALLLLFQFELQVEQQVAPPLPREVGPGRPEACWTPAVLWRIWLWWAVSGQPRPTRPSLRDL